MNFKFKTIFLTLLYLLFISACSVVPFSDCSQTINKQEYEICYQYEYKGAEYVRYTLYGDLVNTNNIKKRPGFYAEKLIPKLHQSRKSDYKFSGYDRGHLASDASFDYNQKVLEKTYSLANVVPQLPQVNRQLWIKTERYERKMAVKFKTVKVLIGVLYDNNNQTIGGNKISIPIAFYKKISNEQNNFAECYYFLNQTQDKAELAKFKINCDDL